MTSTHQHYCAGHDHRWRCDLDPCVQHEATPCGGLEAVTTLGSVEQAATLQQRVEACQAERDALRADLSRVLAERDAVAQDRETLAQVAWQCRTAQRRYFERRDQDSFVLAKRGEARLDQQLARFAPFREPGELSE